MAEKLNSDHKRALLAYLTTFVSQNKNKLFDEIITYRTRHLTVALEDIYQPHNASAVLRTCDCLGIQDVHIIENRNIYEVNPDVALGSSKWLTLIKYSAAEDNTMAAISNLRKNGYRIVATTPHKNDVLLDELPIENKTALFFGTELNGLTDTVVQNADGFVKIPMYGFTESFNISVSAAIVLHQLMRKLINSSIKWQLNADEITDIKLNWCRQVIKRSELLEAKFLKNL